MSDPLSDPVRVTYTAEDLDQHWHYEKLRRRRDSRRPSALKTVVSGVLVVAYLVPLMVFVTSTDDVPVPVTLYIAFAPWLFGAVESRWTAWRARRELAAADEWVEFHITDTGLRCRSQWHDSTIAWHAVDEIGRYRQQYVVDVRGSVRLFIPLHGFRTVDDATRWFATIQSRIEAFRPGVSSEAEGSGSTRHGT